MTTIREHLVRPGQPGPSAGGAATVRLVASTTDSGAVGYSNDLTILGKWTERAVDGIVTFELEPTSTIIPANTVYEIVSQVPRSKASPRYFTVPASGTHWVDDLLTIFPGSLPPGPLSDYTIAIDGGSAASVFAPALTVIDGGTANG